MSTSTYGADLSCWLIFGLNLARLFVTVIAPMILPLKGVHVFIVRLLWLMVLCVPGFAVTISTTFTNPLDRCGVTHSVSGFGTNSYRLAGSAWYGGTIPERAECRANIFDVITTDATGPGFLRVQLSRDIHSLAGPQFYIEGLLPRQFVSGSGDFLIPVELGSRITLGMELYAARTVFTFSGPTPSVGWIDGAGEIRIQAFSENEFGFRTFANFVDLADTPIPEPSTLLLVSVGGGMALFCNRFRKRSKGLADSL